MSEKNYKLPDRSQERMRANVEFGVARYEEDESLRNLGMGRKFHIHTYGCQANVRDGETLTGMLENMGFESTENPEDSDVLIFNTCAIRKAAEEHVFGEIGNLKHLKDEKPNMVFAVCGCMSQEEGVVQRLLSVYTQVDLIFGTHNIHRFPALLKKAMDGQRVVEVENRQKDIVEDMPVARTSAHKAFVNIMYGCDKFCTYCIVPYTRGKQRSRAMEYIIEEVEQLKKNGCKEVTLLGQNVNAYGKDLGMEDGFTELLKQVSATGIERIRFYSSHPRDYTFTSIEAMRDHANIMHALHLPVQSGSTEVLKKMNRGYSAEHFKTLFDEMKQQIPDLAFTTDLIVGFPGETEEQFMETMELVDYCQFDMAYAFAFSPREGTPAAEMDGALSDEVKKERLARLNEKLSYYAKQKNLAYVGKTVKVLVDGPSKKNPNVFSGYSEENKLVNFTGKNICVGDIVEVRITDAKSFTLDGEAIEK